AMPRSYGCSPATCWRRLGEWQRRGVWKRVWRVILEHAGPYLRMALIDSPSIQSPKARKVM
ncbi:MAG: IS5/IS1182 family transposase, partial [Nitrososphaerota archaeon]